MDTAGLRCDGRSRPGTPRGMAVRVARASRPRLRPPRARLHWTIEPCRAGLHDLADPANVKLQKGRPTCRPCAVEAHKAWRHARRGNMCAKGLHDLSVPGAARLRPNGFRDCVACRAARPIPPRERAPVLTRSSATSRQSRRVLSAGARLGTCQRSGAGPRDRPSAIGALTRGRDGSGTAPALTCGSIDPLGRAILALRGTGARSERRGATTLAPSAGWPESQRRSLSPIGRS